jgi:hypothetical protein
MTNTSSGLPKTRSRIFLRNANQKKNFQLLECAKVFGVKGKAETSSGKQTERHGKLNGLT